MLGSKADMLHYRQGACQRDKQLQLCHSCMLKMLVLAFMWSTNHLSCSSPNRDVEHEQHNPLTISLTMSAL